MHYLLQGADELLPENRHVPNLRRLRLSALRLRPGAVTFSWVAVTSRPGPRRRHLVMMRAIVAGITSTPLPGCGVPDVSTKGGV
jgi:hypothetical protein